MREKGRNNKANKSIVTSSSIHSLRLSSFTFCSYQERDKNKTLKERDENNGWKEVIHKREKTQKRGML
jgi:hypothetical protein